MSDLDSWAKFNDQWRRGSWTVAKCYFAGSNQWALFRGGARQRDKPFKTALEAMEWADMEDETDAAK